MERKTNQKVNSKIDFNSKTEEVKNRQMILSIVESRITFSDDILISRTSRYGDSTWSWEDSSNPRLRAYCTSALKIDWEYYKHFYNLTDDIITDLKKYFFFRINYSTIIFSETKCNAKPSAAIAQIRRIASFLCHVRLNLSVAGVSLVNKLSDIEMQDLRDSFESYPESKKSALKIILSQLGSEILGRHLTCGFIKWNRSDIDTLPWKRTKSVPHERLPDGLFAFLSNNAVKDVLQFLQALNIQTYDKTTVNRISPFSNFVCDFSEIFERYVKLRNDLSTSKATTSDIFLWAKRKKLNTSQLEELINRARYAARIIIMLYTGARLSEFTGFKLDCLRCRDDTWVIVGTVVKNRDLNAITESDEWVAIPIVRDAVQVLKQTARIVKSSLLFHSGRHASFAFVSDKFVNSLGVSVGVKKYIDFVDEGKQWTNVQAHSHQFRNSLAYEMRRCSLGLPFITYQLKHAYNAIEREINDVTLGYGSIGSEAVQKAIADAHFDALKELYDPDSPVAGGGAERHKERRAAYFQGMALRDISVNDVLHQLAKEGTMPLTDVGLGYCQGQTAKIVVDGIKVDPPCIGSLRCNPVRCQNGIIPKHKLPAWKKSLSENETRLENPDFAYARSYLAEAVEEAQSVINLFQIQKKDRKEKRESK